MRGDTPARSAIRSAVVASKPSRAKSVKRGVGQRLPDPRRADRVRRRRALDHRGMLPFSDSPLSQDARRRHVREARLRRLGRRQPPLRGGRRLHPLPAVALRGRDPLRRRERPRQARDPRQGQRDHPQSHVRRDPDAGRVDRVLPRQQPRGQEPARARAADPLPGRVPASRPAPPAHGRAGHRRVRGLPHHRGSARGAHEGRRRAHARGRARVQPVAARRLDLQLRGPHHPDPGRHPARRRAGGHRARVVPRPRRQDRAHPARAGAPARRLVPLARARPTSIRSGGCARTPASR